MTSLLNWLKVTSNPFATVEGASDKMPRMCADTVMAKAYRVNMVHEILADR